MEAKVQRGSGATALRAETVDDALKLLESWRYTEKLIRDMEACSVNYVRMGDFDNFVSVSFESRRHDAWRRAQIAIKEAVLSAEKFVQKERQLKLATMGITVVSEHKL